MNIEVKEITVSPGQEYVPSSYPVSGFYLVSGYGVVVVIGSPLYVQYVCTTDQLDKLKSSPPAQNNAISEDFVIRVMETAIRETKR